MLAYSPSATEARLSAGALFGPLSPFALWLRASLLVSLLFPSRFKSRWIIPVTFSQRVELRAYLILLGTILHFTTLLWDRFLHG